MPTDPSTSSFALLLPRLQDTSTPNAQPGDWQPYSRTDVLRFSDEFDFKAPDEARINSIPDLWARPLLFQLALYDEKHPLHRQVVGEWRGLLAALAFKEQRNLPLARMDLDATGNPRSAFLDALVRMAPANTLHASANWQDVCLLTWSREPIGLLSPTTLVTTAASCAGRISGLEWFDANTDCLISPVPFLNHTERGDLARWLAQLRSGLANLEVPPPVPGAGGFDPVSDMHNKLLTRLNSFIADLGGAPAAANAANLIDHERGFGFRSELYEGLNHPLRAPEVDPGASHVRLIPSAGRQPSRPVLVIDRGLAKQFDLPEKSITVSGVTDLGQALRNKLSRTDALGSTVRVWDKDHFFTPRLLCVTDVTNAFPGTLPVRGAEQLRYKGVPAAPIPPIHSRVLEYLGAEELARSLSYQQEGEGIKVNLLITLSGPHGSGQKITLEKIYEKYDRIEHLPIIEVWPNLSNAASHSGSPWKSYYTYFSTEEWEFADASGETNIFYARPYTRDEPASAAGASASRREVRRLESFPEAFICEARQRDGGASLQPAGLLLLPPPKEINAPAIQWDVGVDFGTSSTHVYYRPGNSPQPVPMRFQNLSLAVTDQSGRNDALAGKFIPGREILTPFLSLFQVRDARHRLQGGSPITDGVILYLDRQAVGFNANDPQLKRDLKWSSESDHQEVTLTFLRQLALQCAAEAFSAGATSIRWCFSYPSAFSESKQDEYRSNWRVICRDTARDTGIRWLDADSGRPREKTESLAVACYFIELHHATPASGAVFVDIGGGTTDVSVWHGAGRNRRDLQLQTSVQYAGRDLFIQPLFHFGRSLLPDLLVKAQGGGDAGLSTSLAGFAGAPPDYNRFGTLVDSLVTRYNDELMSELPRVSAGNAYKQLRGAFAVRFGGLLYYIGLLVRALREDTNEPGITGEHMPDIYFGGNGARVLNWLERGSFSNSGLCSRKLLKPLLAMAAGFPENSDFNLELSREPKAEVAAGLVAPDTPETPVGGKPRIVSGEAFSLVETRAGQSTRETRPWQQSLTAASYSQELHVDSLDQIKAFLAAYSRLAVAMELPAVPALSGTDERTIRNRVQDTLVPRAQRDVVVEPLYISALRTYLDRQP